jgi:hypothetical protein
LFTGSGGYWRGYGARGITTTGAVVREFTESGGGDSGRVRKSVIEFFDANQLRFQFAGRLFSVGSEVPVVYYPGWARVYEAWRPVWNMTVSAVFLLAISAFLLFL